MKIFRLISILAVIVIFSYGCASSRSGRVYTRDQARVTHTVKTGTIEKVDLVKIEGTKTPVGVVAGGATGAALGNTIGQGSAKTISTVVGAIVGGLAGSAVEEKVTEKDGFEITVKLDNGETIVIVQEADEDIRVGMRARVLRGSDGTTRVRPE
jgi:outer membrane lipoprotein SlyB